MTAHLLGLHSWGHGLWLKLGSRTVHLGRIVRLLHQVLSPLLLLLVIVLVAWVRWLYLLLLLLMILSHVHHLIAIRLHLWRLGNRHIVSHGVCGRILGCVSLHATLVVISLIYIWRHLLDVLLRRHLPVRPGRCCALISLGNWGSSMYS